MQWGSDWAQTMRRSHLSQDVTYTRPNGFAITLPATFARTTRTINDGTGVLVAFESWAFVLTRADLIYNATKITPEVGDFISYVRDGVTHRYDVTNQGGQSCWSDHDRFKRAIVVYTDLYDSGVT